MKKNTDIWDKLQNEPTEAPFRVPDGYFETLEDRIEAQIEQANNPVTKKGKLIRMMKPLLGMAASFALVFLLVYYPLSVYLPDYLSNNSETAINKDETPTDEDFLFSYFAIITNSVYDISESDEEEIEMNDEEILDYLAISMNETEIYAELK